MLGEPGVQVSRPSTVGVGRQRSFPPREGGRQGTRGNDPSERLPGDGTLRVTFSKQLDMSVTESLSRSPRRT